MAKNLLIAMSLRKDSFNKKLIQVASQIANEGETLSFNDYLMPLYSGDDETNMGVPEAATRLAKKISEARAMIIATPEYNGGIAGTFKNTIDWLSRVKPMPWKEKHILLLGASPGALGAVRGLWHSRVPLEAVGAYVFPDMFGLPQADKAFTESGQLQDAKTAERLNSLIKRFLAHSMAAQTR